MKTSDNFKKVIESKLQEMAKNDELFAKSLAKENKNIDDCITYILNQVKQSGCVGFADDEIFGMAAHYYDEDDINIGAYVNCKVVVNHHVEAKQIDSEPRKQNSVSRKQPKPKKEEPKETNQLSLF